MYFVYLFPPPVKTQIPWGRDFLKNLFIVQSPVLHQFIIHNRLSVDIRCCWSVSQSRPTLWPPARQASLSYTVSRSLLNSCPLSRWCHPTISSSVVPFSSCPQSFRESGSFLMSQLFTSSSQRIGASASASVLPMNIQDWFPLGWTGLISLQSKGLSRFSPTPQFKIINLQCSAFFMVQLSHPYVPTGETIALTRQTFVGKVMSLVSNMLSSLVTAFLLRSKHLLISWPQSPSAVILEPKKIKFVTASNFSSSICYEWDGTGCHDLSFLTLKFKPAFSLSSFIFIKRLFISSSLPAI